MTKKTRICSGCIDEFDIKEIYIALVPSGDYYTCYCKKCLEKKEIVKFKPYNKPRSKKNKE